MKQITQKELGVIVGRIMQEAETQANYNGTNFIGYTLEEMADKVRERIGDDWEIKDAKL